MSTPALFVRFASAVAGRVLTAEVKRFTAEHPIGRRFVEHLQEGKPPFEAAVELACEVAEANREQGE